MTEITKTQRKQLDWLWKVEQKEAKQGLGTLNQIECTCKTCGKSRIANCADSARNFVLLHEGHYTWLQYVGRVDALKANNDRRWARGQQGRQG